MRLPMLVCCALLIFAASLGGQSENIDAYSISLVKSELQMRSGGLKVIHTWSQKQLFRLGDVVSIALLKILDERDLTNPETVKGFLPIIRDSFSQPQLISIEVDKKPVVTLFLLRHLQQEVSDAQVLQDIQQTMGFVQEKTAQDKD